MSNLASEDFSGRHLREVLKRQPVLCDMSYYHEGVKVLFETGQQLAFDESHPDVPAAMAAHARRMRQRIYQVGDRVYCAVGYALANVIIVRGEGALVVLDTTESHDSASQIWHDFKQAMPEVCDWPVAALVYTHNHSDHINGARAFVDEAAVKAGRTQIISHSTLMKAVAENASVVAPILRTRSAYSFGALLPPGPQGAASAGIGPKIVNGAVSFLPPTRTFFDELNIELAGLRFEFRHAPSETDDEIVAWLPDLGVLLSAEVIQGECLANVHTLRGTRYRDPQQWVTTLDQIRARHAQQPVQWMVPAHGRPVGGAQNIDELLTAYRDSIAFIHDQAVRFINHGATPDELADWLPALPPHLARHAWLGEYYGTVKHCVRQVFNGLLGWFDGDPATLDPLAPKERAIQWVKLAGGRSAVLSEIHQSQSVASSAQSSPEVALDACRWIAELANLLIRIDRTDQEARKAKAQALRQLGFATLNTNWRNWYLTSARELLGDFDAFEVKGNSLAVRDLLMALEPAQLLQWLAVRVQAEKCLDVHSTLSLDLTDRAQSVVLEIRRGVLQISMHALGHKTKIDGNRLTLNWPDWVSLMIHGMTDLPEAMRSGKVQLTSGTPNELKLFLSYFEPRAAHLPSLAVRSY